MKTYDEYCDILRKDGSVRGNRVDQEVKDRMNLLGTYGDIMEIGLDEKNDDTLYRNHTNICNSEWNILFSVLVMATLDWCIENGCSNIWRLDMNLVNRNSGLRVDYCVFEDDMEFGPSLDDELNERFRGWSEYVGGMLRDFAEKHRENMPQEWNCLGFMVDGIKRACRSGGGMGNAECDCALTLWDINNVVYVEII